MFNVKLFRLLWNQRGEGEVIAGGDPPAAGGDPPAGTNGADWRAPYMADASLKPVVEKMTEYKSVGDALKSLDWHKSQLGKAVFLKDPKNAEERKTAQARAYELGIFDKPDIPEAADKYEFNLDAVPEQLRSDALLNEFRETAHKLGMNKAQVAAMAGLYNKMFEGEVKPVLEIDAKQAQDEFEAWAKSTGKESKALEVAGGAWLAKNVSEAQLKVLERAGLADHPALLKLVAQAGLDTGEDISIIEGAGAGGSAESELADLEKTLADSTHENYKLFWSGDQQDPKRIALLAKRDELFKKRWGMSTEEK